MWLSVVPKTPEEEFNRSYHCVWVLFCYQRAARLNLSRAADGKHSYCKYTDGGKISEMC